jgi:hypothetical protein
VNSQNTARSWTALIAGVIALLLVVLLFSASYLAGLTLCAGILLPSAVYLLLARVGNASSPARLRQTALLLSLALVSVIAVGVAYVATRPAPYPSYLTATVRAYSATIRPGASGVFTVIEDADAELDGFTVVTTTQALRTPRTRTSRAVASTGKGWLLREVSFVPLAGVEFPLPDGERIQPLFLPDEGAKLTAQVQDLPAGSLYAIRRAQATSASAYLDTETTVWTIPDLQESITFAYLPSPWHILKPLIAPFLTLPSLARWLVGIVCMIGGTLFGAFAQPALVRLVRERLAPGLMRRIRRDTGAPTAADKAS